MRSALIAAGSGVGLAVAGWAMPIAFPTTSPAIGKGSLLVAATLIAVSILLWLFDNKSSVSRKEDDNSIHQNHSGFGHNIIADEVRFETPRFSITPSILDEIVSGLDKQKPVSISYADDRHSKAIAPEITAYLRNLGFRISDAFIQMPKGTMECPIFVSQDGIPLGPSSKAVPGLQLVYVDATVWP